MGSSHSGSKEDDESDLNRFVVAQETIYDNVLIELKNGKKLSHWMWFIFPQIQGLGSSPNAVRYAIKDVNEAKAYLSHSVLGTRMRQCCEALLEITGKSAYQIMGSPDDLKLRSSMTLFSTVAEEPVFKEVLRVYFRGEADPRTLQLLKS